MPSGSPPRRKSRWEDAGDDAADKSAGAPPEVAEPRKLDGDADADDEHRDLRRRSRSRSPRRRGGRSRSRSRDRGGREQDYARERRGRDEERERRHRRDDEDDEEDRRRRQRQQQQSDGGDRGGNAAGQGQGQGQGQARRQSRWDQIDAAADAADQRRVGAGGGGGGGGGGVEQQQQQQHRAPAEEGKPPLQQPPPPPPQPQFGLSGALAAETNTTAEGVTLVHAPPADAAPAPNGGALKGRRWRLYVFKGGREIEGGEAPPISLTGPSSTFLFGRDRRVADIPTDHLSCSKQHAVIQFRRTGGGGSGGNSSASSLMVSRPYLMDLGSTNGTWLNGDRLEAQRYHELLPKDVVRFGESTREFVVLTEESV